MKIEKKIVSVIVAYDRLEELECCIKSVLNQSYGVYKIIVIDNSNNDLIEKYMKKFFYIKKVEYKKNKYNIGAIGGFRLGMQEAEKYSPDFYWIIDDDAEPAYDCLEKLLIAHDVIDNNIGFLVSSIYGINGEAMNTPQLSAKRDYLSGYPTWYNNLSNKCVEVSSATTVCLLITSNAVKKIGYFCKEYFLWGGDIEYTLRITSNDMNGYIVGDSLCIHKRKNGKIISIINENDTERIKMMYTLYMNTLINHYIYGEKKDLFRYYLSCINLIFFKIPFKAKHRLVKISIVIKGLLLGIYKRSQFKKIIENEIKNH